MKLINNMRVEISEPIIKMFMAELNLNSVEEVIGALKINVMTTFKHQLEISGFDEKDISFKYSVEIQEDT